MEQCFLLLGSEREKKKEYIEKISAQYPKAERYVYHCFDTSLRTLLETLEGASLFSEHTIVLYDFVEQLQNEGDVALLKRYINSPAPGTLLFCISNQNTVQRSLAGLFSSDARKIFWPLYESSQPGWVRQWCRKHQRTISDEAVSLLLERVEHNIQALTEQLERLLSCTARDITEESVDLYVSRNKQEDVFSLFKALLEGNMDYALYILEIILPAQQHRRTSVLAGLRWQLQQILLLHQLLEEGETTDTVFERLNIQSKRAQKQYREALRALNRGSVEFLLMELADCEARIRSLDTRFEHVLLELLCYRIFTQARQ